MCGCTGWLSFRLAFFACFRRVIGLIVVSLSLFCFLLVCLKTEPCSLCTNMYAFGDIII